MEGGMYKTGVGKLVFTVIAGTLQTQEKDFLFLQAIQMLLRFMFISRKVEPLCGLTLFPFPNWVNLPNVQLLISIEHDVIQK